MDRVDGSNTTARTSKVDSLVGVPAPLHRNRTRLRLPLALTLVLFIPLWLFLGHGMAANITLEGGIARGLVIAYSAVRVAQLYTSGEPRWFSLFFWTFCYVWMGLAAFAQVMVGTDPFGRTIEPSADAYSAEVVLMGMVAWDVCYSVRRSSLSKIRDAGKSWSANRIVTPSAAGVVAILSAVSTLVLLKIQGSLLGYFQTRSQVDSMVESSASDSSGSLAVYGLLKAATQVPPLAALLCLVAVLRYYPHCRRSPGWWVLGAGVVALNVLVNNPLGSSRFWFATVLFGVLLTFPFFRRPRGVRVFVAALVMAQIVVFPYADMFRSPEYQVKRQSISEFMARKLDYDAPAQLSNGIRRYNDLGPELGHQVLGALAMPIPRSAWASKPYPTGELIAKYDRFHFVNLSAPLWVEGYVDFGLLGAILFLAVAGALSAAGDDRIMRTQNGPPTLASILFPPLAVYSMVLIRGSLQGTIAQGIALLGFMMLVGTLCLRRDMYDLPEMGEGANNQPPREAAKGRGQNAAN